MYDNLKDGKLRASELMDEYAKVKEFSSQVKKMWNSSRATLSLMLCSAVLPLYVFFFAPWGMMWWQPMWSVMFVVPIMYSLDSASRDIETEDMMIELIIHGRGGVSEWTLSERTNTVYLLTANPKLLKSFGLALDADSPKNFILFLGWLCVVFYQLSLDDFDGFVF